MTVTKAFGKYQLLAQVGLGGMADVYLAVVQGPGRFNKLQVIKCLRASLADDPEFVAMFMDEARLAGRLDHPNIVQTNEVGHIGDQYFIAMEYLSGQPLHRLIRAARARGGLDTSIAYGIVADVLAGLHYAHELTDFDGSPLQVVHRDVSPQNVFVTYEGQTKVVDFGIAKAAGRSTATKDGVVKGKVRYMAPEQLSSSDVDARADVFAVGVMLWEAAAGRTLWQDSDELLIIKQLVSDNIPSSPRAVNPVVPKEIDEICQRALAWRPEDRYASAAEMQKDLERYLRSSGERASSGDASKYVCDLFADVRKETASLIKAKLSELSGEFTPTSGVTPPSGITSAGQPQNAPPSASMAISSQTDVADGLANTTILSPEGVRQGIGRPGQRVWIAMGVGAALIAAGGGLVATRKRGNDGTASETARSVATAATAVATPAGSAQVGAATPALSASAPVVSATSPPQKPAARNPLPVVPVLTKKVVTPSASASPAIPSAPPPASTPTNHDDGLSTRK